MRNCPFEQVSLAVQAHFIPTPFPYRGVGLDGLLFLNPIERLFLVVLKAYTRDGAGWVKIDRGRAAPVVLNAVVG